MNLAEAMHLVDDEPKFLEVPYCAQLLAQLEKWHSIIWSFPKPEKRPASSPGARGSGGPVRGFRRDSIPHQVMKQLLEHSPDKLSNVQLCVLLPGLPHKPIAVALYELTHKGLLESSGQHNALRYGVTKKGRALAARFDGN